MISLPNNCKRGALTVHPANWKTLKARTGFHWYISYRFYDPAHTQPKQVSIRGMNSFTGLKARQDATAIILEDELRRLHEEGYNPFTGISYIESADSSPVSEYSPFPEALQYALDCLQCRTKNEVRKAVVHINTAIKELRYANMPISAIKRKHVRFVLDRIGINKGGWKPSSFNHYRSYLMMLFDALQEIEVADIDLRKIKKQKELPARRRTLTVAERKKIQEHLSQPVYKYFWRFIQIFYHSGARMSELMTVKKEDVDLTTQSYDVVTYKGSRPRWIKKVIKNIALPIWKELINEAGPGQFLFSKYLKPGRLPINSHQVTKRWRIHVKQELEIECDIYSLKHLHTTEVVDLLDAKAAAKMNGHTSTQMVAKIYDIRRNERNNEDLKALANVFV